MALSPRLRQLVFLLVWRLGFKHGSTPRAEEQHARDHVPELFKEPGRLLYIGAHPTRQRLIDTLWKAGHEITLLEIWPPNAAYFADDARFEHVVCGDARDLPGGVPYQSYDTVVWWHGPEHVAKHESLATFAKLEKVAPLVVLGMPLGMNLNESDTGNPHDAHVSGWHEDELALAGYESAVLKDKRAPHAHLLAWKRRA